MDTFGHVNHAVHLNYFEQARFEALARCGFTYDVLAQRGWAIHVVRIEVDYLSEVLLGDRLRIRTWAGEFRRASMVMLQEARRDPREGEVESTPVARGGRVDRGGPPCDPGTAGDPGGVRGPRGTQSLKYRFHD